MVRYAKAWRRHIGRHWFTGALVLTCSIFTLNSLRDRSALREFESHIAEMADGGGGVFFLISALDCLEVAEMAGHVAAALQAKGLAVEGLVISHGLDQSELGLVLDAANERFPHSAVSWRAVVAAVGRVGTPVVLAVSPSGEIGAMELFGSLSIDEAPELVRRLSRAVTEVS